MTDITLKNFRCFGNEQTVPLAPLTLLVGENSTGKTSFMAMIRALWDLVFNGDEPNFNKPPYDLGSFDEILHDNVEWADKSKSFEAKCSLKLDYRGRQSKLPYHISVEFKQDGPIPVLDKLLVSHEDTWIEWSLGSSESDKELNVACGVRDSAWDLKSPSGYLMSGEFRGEQVLSYFRHFGSIMHSILLNKNRAEDDFMARDGTKTLSQNELGSLRSLSRYLSRDLTPSLTSEEAYASAPVQSSPQRTYEVSRPIRDTGGRHAPNYLAYVCNQQAEEWGRIKRAMEEFGRTSGLFDRINIERLGATGGAQFQVEIGLSQNGIDVADRNLTDVGYGVSQVLPVLTEVLRRDARQLLLFQQPEVHLHPRAQAALGSLFCNMAGKDRQIIVETHSDYIPDRVRMDVRDQKCKLQYRDVVILFFERSGSNVKIHPIKLDLAGNIIDAPPSYRQFFLREIDRLFRY